MTVTEIDEILGSPNSDGTHNNINKLYINGVSLINGSWVGLSGSSVRLENFEFNDNRQILTLYYPTGNKNAIQEIAYSSIVLIEMLDPYVPNIPLKTITAYQSNANLMDWESAALFETAMYTQSQYTLYNPIFLSTPLEGMVVSDTGWMIKEELNVNTCIELSTSVGGLSISETELITQFNNNHELVLPNASQSAIYNNHGFNVKGGTKYIIEVTLFSSINRNMAIALPYTDWSKTIVVNSAITLKNSSQVLQYEFTPTEDAEVYCEFLFGIQQNNVYESALLNISKVEVFNAEDPHVQATNSEGDPEIAPALS